MFNNNQTISSLSKLGHFKKSGRQVFLDTETTGRNPQKGDKILEIGALEMVNRQLTGNKFHYIVDPECDIPLEVIKIHGIDNKKVFGCPKFFEIADKFVDFVKGAELLIHNATFDISFLDNELRLLNKDDRYVGRNRNLAIVDICQITDTLTMARDKFSGKGNSLDALCDRFGIDRSNRTYHGALLDSELLVKVYLNMTQEQYSLNLSTNKPDSDSDFDLDASVFIQKPSDDDLALSKKHNKNVEDF